MRLGLLVIAMAACSSPAAAGPSWPRPTASEVDGGESLAPRAAARAVVAVVEDDKPADRAADKPTAASGVPGADRPAAATIPVPAADEPIMTEDIVIEIED
jgi:hypothetical protein